MSPERIYIDGGPVVLALLDPAAERETARPSADNFWFSAADLDDLHARTIELECLSNDGIHGNPAGAIVTRPWGERSVYAVDPSGS